MGPGRKPLPSKVHFLHGNPSKKTEAQLLDNFRPDVELPKCPRYLSLKGVAQAEAKREYLRLGEQLERYGLVSSLDRGVLAMMATEWGRYVWAEEKIAAANLADEAKGEAGLIESTHNGYRKQSVLLEISRKSIELYLKLAVEFGLTPSSRTRVTPGATQMALPGIEQPGKPTLSSFA